MKKSLIKLHNRITALELLVLAGWTTLMSIYIAPSSFVTNLHFFVQNPSLILLNTLPVAAVLLLIFFLTANSFLSGAITNLIFGMLNYANLLKIDGRDDPLVPADFGLLREALKATGDYRLDMHWGIVAIIAVSTAVLLLLGLSLGRRRSRRAWPRIVGAVLMIGVFLCSYFALYRDTELHDSYPVSSQYNITSVFNELGFNYCFIYNFDLYSADRPEGYSSSEVEGWETEFTPTAPEGDTPNVIMIMCEAFSELNADSAFTYSEEDSPLHDYYTVKNGDNCIASGEIIVPNFGAGTANTEFDVISGMQTNLISRISNSAMRSFHRDIPTMATVLADLGYSTFYMHPGDSWFYNRDSALSHMGFQNKLFVEDMLDQSIMDSVFLDTLTAELEARTANGERLYTYATTIQNHQSYTYGKYSYDIPRVQVSVPLSAEAEELLSVYSYGIKCSSEMLLELTDYLNSLEAPYLLVFFGDHKPNLGADYMSYRELGMNTVGDGSVAGMIESCSAPYIVWANDAYLEGRDAAALSASLGLPEGGQISANYLGELTLELCGAAGADPFFSFLGELRRELPVIKSGVVSNADGSVCSEPDEAAAALVGKLHCWQYYRMS